MNVNETLLMEAVKNLLHGSMLGIDPHEDSDDSHHQQFTWSKIEESFRSKVNDSPFHDSITSAFHAVHSYKYLDDPKFIPAMQAELRSRAVPLKEQNMAIEAIKKTAVEILKDSCERDAGWSEELKSIVDMIQNPERKVEKTEPFTGGVV